LLFEKTPTSDLVGFFLRLGLLQTTWVGYIG